MRSACRKLRSAISPPSSSEAPASPGLPDTGPRVHPLRSTQRKMLRDGLQSIARASRCTARGKKGAAAGISWGLWIGEVPARIEARDSGGEPKVALWSADGRAEAGFVGALGGEVEADAFEGQREFVRIHAHDFEIRQAAALWSVLGRVDGVRAPFDEEGEKAVAVVGEVDGFPSEDAAVRALSGAVVGACEGDLVFAKLLGDGSDVRRMDGPAHEARIAHFPDLREMADLLLSRGRGDDFQVAAVSERAGCVARAAAGMDSANRGAHAGALFDQFAAAIEIVSAEKDVIEQCGHLIVLFRVRRPGYGRRGECASG